jgi:uncharacterized protein YfiM (DUF2279 family)
MSRYARVLAVSLALATAVAAQSVVSGKWEGRTPGGSAVLLDMAAKGAALTGTMTVDGEKAPLTDGRVAKNTFSFSVTLGGGTEAFTGEVAGDETKIWMDSRGQAAAIVLKRMK